MKKRILLAALLLCTALLTACGAPSTEDSTARAVVPQGKVDYLGGWQDSSDAHAVLTVVPTQSGGDYAVEISWNTDTEKSVAWTLNATFNEESRRLEYQNGSKFERTRGADGAIVSETQLASDGSGSLSVNKKGEIEWKTDLEGAAKDFRFTRTYCQIPTAEELAENFLRPVTKIGQGSAGSSLRNASTACGIIAYAYSRDLWNANPTELQAALRDAHASLSEEEASAFSANYDEMTQLANATLKSLDSRIGYYEDAGVGDTIRELMQNDFARFSWSNLFANQMTMNFSA